MEGLAGAGAFSDGKYIITHEYGGWLADLLDPEVVINYIEQADSILVSFGATTERFMPNNDLKKLCLQNGLYMHQAQVKHLGTDHNYVSMTKLIEYLGKRVEICTRANVSEVDKDNHVITVNDKHNITADKIIFAVGRVGSSFFSKWCNKHSIPLTNNQVDIGVRVELDSLIWEDFSKKIYEPKILYRSKQYEDITRMFCFNDRGHVVTENTNGVLTVNGHSFRDEKLKTKNSNFALLSTINFTQPFKDPIEYARATAYLANLISGGQVLVQRLGDLRRGRRTTETRIKKGAIRPTLEAVPGDLSLCIPKRQLDNIIETLGALDKIAPGTANDDTLLYGIECKYYSARPKCNKDFLIEGCKDVYAVGDGAGFTRSLSQAAANGLYVADIISKQGQPKQENKQKQEKKEKQENKPTK
ncbi:FAD dependent oxidoreductase [Tritrichomonas foetus]|uniref:FAD dependent oxidoreductase n=1 Tax=Tritrichomonas foetus TaxID=1144522 RepID=A0A1J4JQZ4_9EUKA|nr:FAD dependent oxidoreductase [Tritrichomonas foetus]|eukprot:OHT01599.1 FAD dependent oxidoreductase [Tritrichomonas foetus]